MRSTVSKSIDRLETSYDCLPPIDQGMAEVAANGVRYAAGMRVAQ